MESSERTVVGQLLVGQLIAGKFLVEAYLGGGAMGSVYRARQTILRKTVAIKVMSPRLTAEPELAARFLREAQAASRVDHPNSMRVLDFGEEPNGLLYIAMEYVDGRDLYTLVKEEEGRLTSPRIADVLMQTCAALSVAHEMGVVHRDLKPENIMVLSGIDDEGRPTDVVKVCDFGIAKLVDVQAELEARSAFALERLVVGTPEYISPEQAMGVAQDARSDVYSLGVILFELLTGRVPFRGETPAAIMIQHVSSDPPRPRALDPTIEPRLEAICLRAMRKSPDARYASAREMRADLRAIYGTRPMRPVLALPIEPSPHEVRSALATLEGPSRSRSRLAGYVLAAVLLVGALGVARWMTKRAETPSVVQPTPRAATAAVPTSSSSVRITSGPLEAVDASTR